MMNDATFINGNRRIYAPQPMEPNDQREINYVFIRLKDLVDNGFIRILLVIAICLLIVWNSVFIYKNGMNI